MRKGEREGGREEGEAPLPLLIPHSHTPTHPPTLVIEVQNLSKISIFVITENLHALKH